MREVQDHELPILEGTISGFPKLVGADSDEGPHWALDGMISREME